MYEYQIKSLNAEIQDFYEKIDSYKIKEINIKTKNNIFFLILLESLKFLIIVKVTILCLYLKIYFTNF